MKCRRCKYNGDKGKLDVWQCKKRYTDLGVTCLMRHIVAGLQANRHYVEEAREFMKRQEKDLDQGEDWKQGS
jgi:hypothetical protein